MATGVQLKHVEKAHAAQDPQTVDLLIQLIEKAPDPNQPPPRKGLYDFNSFLQEISQPKFYRQSSEVQYQQRLEKLKAVEANEPNDIHERYRSHEFIFRLWQSKDPFDRQCLLDVIQRVPLIYGPWKALKKIFKEAEECNDTKVLGLLSSRFDTAFSSGRHNVSHRTLGYLTRRAWRYLRRVAQTLPACYADTAVDFLVGYPKSGWFRRAWVYNHLFQHEQKAHKRSRFHFGYGKSASKASEYHKTRAYPELWKRSPLPLFALLQQAQNGDILQYAISALKFDFRNELREVEPKWVRQLIHNDSGVVHNFAVWILENVPHFEQSKFRELELHDTVLLLLESSAKPAREFAAKYARVHARDMPVSQLVRLANSNEATVRELAKDLLGSYDPRTEVGLEAWGLLLRTQHGNALAVDALRKHFTSDDLSPPWFAEQLLSGSKRCGDFARARLLELHSAQSLGHQFFIKLIDEAAPELHRNSITFAVEQLEKFDLAEVETADLELMLINTVTRFHVVNWVNVGLLPPNRFDPEFLKAIAFQPTYEECPQVIAARQKPWGAHTDYAPELAQRVFQWFNDIRQFTPDQIGFQWLMMLVQREEPEYHNFAKDLMIKSYLPADFSTDSSSKKEEATKEAKDEINIDFDGATFVFTGKLATMTRAEAQKKVIAANGANSGSVGKKLSYLIIGDEGSPMYGMGRKGSKQLKAESLNESGAEIRIISETAFLQMLTGTQREFSDDAVLGGCENLWAMLMDNKEGSSLSRFAIKYIRHHHPEICLAETDRPVDPGAEMPDEFLTFERMEELLSDKRKSLRELGLELCRFEFARMAPTLGQLVELCQLPYPAVRKFVAEALTAKASPQNRRWLLDSTSFSAEDVYQFCQSRDRETRAIGMKLIDLHPRLREPDQLFALTESPDRTVRAFVIRTFWSLYRDRGTKEDWKPRQPDESLLKKKNARRKEETDGSRFGTGAPKRPDQLPAAYDRMQFLLRRMLFEIPPGRPPKARGDEIDDLKVTPLPTRRAKILLIETLRDTALEDQEFASVVYPVLVEFMESRGMSEHAACLVAVTRIENAFPEFRQEVEA